MNLHKREALSALFDGELSEFEMRRLLAELSTDDLQQWRRYQLLRDCCEQSPAISYCQVDVSNLVAAQIAQEPSMRKAWYKPVVGFASAAVFAFVAVIGVQGWQQQDDMPAGFVAEGNVSASQLPISSSPGLSTASAKSAASLTPRQEAVLKPFKSPSDEKSESDMQLNKDTSK